MYPHRGLPRRAFLRPPRRCRWPRYRLWWGLYRRYIRQRWTGSSRVLRRVVSCAWRFLAGRERCAVLLGRAAPGIKCWAGPGNRFRLHVHTRTQNVCRRPVQQGSGPPWGRYRFSSQRPTVVLSFPSRPIARSTLRTSRSVMSSQGALWRAAPTSRDSFSPVS